MERLGESGSGFRSLTEAIDTTTPAGRMMMQMVGHSPSSKGRCSKSGPKPDWMPPAKMHAPATPLTRAKTQETGFGERSDRDRSWRAVVAPMPSRLTISRHPSPSAQSLATRPPESNSLRAIKTVEWFNSRHLRFLSCLPHVTSAACSSKSNLFLRPSSITSKRAMYAR